jgi:triosephosphate isomerase
MSQAGKPIYLVANWKSNKTWAETEVFLQSFRGFREEGNVVNIVCPPIPYLKASAEVVKSLHLPVKLGVQDVSPFPFGAYTGAVAAQMLLDTAQYAIVGHSERRRYFHETNQEVANKVAQCLEVNITPVVCVDEPYLRAQINALEPEQLKKVMVAYEPLTAIGSGKPAEPQDAQKVAEQIVDVAERELPVLYGGSVTPENIGEFLEQPLIHGALVGGASLTVESWKGIIQAAAKA